MGCFVSNERSENDEIEFRRNRRIDKIIGDINHRNGDKNLIKLLLLGTGDSGKSTFIKQMKLIHNNSFSHNELLYFQNVLRYNSLYSMQRVLNYSGNIGHQFNEDTMELKTMIEEASDLTPDIASAIRKVWEGEEVKTFYEDHLNEIQVPSSSYYYFENSERFAADDYKPTDEDVLRAKLKTTGIIETKFAEKDIEFTLVDVGGQRAERRKWLHCFDDVSAVIYLAALDEYNMVLQEDGITNRMEESLTLFKEVTGAQWFSGKSFILFLNKSDLFKGKNKNTTLKKVF